MGAAIISAPTPSTGSTGEMAAATRRATDLDLNEEGTWSTPEPEVFMEAK
jgi:hypothetical protein